jgi:integrase
MYAGLRRGELMALRANRIDLDANVIRVEYGWDPKAGEIDTKNRKSRIVPIPAPLRELLLPQLLRTGRRDDDLVFGRRRPNRSRRSGCGIAPTRHGPGRS